MNQDPSNLSHFPQSLASPLLSNEEALTAFINADGNLNLCAERTGCDRADIVAALATDLPRLQQQLRVLSVINLSHEAQALRRRVRETISQLEPEDAMRSYIGMNQLINSLTDDKASTLNLNVNDVAFSRIPRHIQEAIVELERLEQEQQRHLVTAGAVHDSSDEDE